jgi:hypothetical protein
MKIANFQVFKAALQMPLSGEDLERHKANMWWLSILIPL